MALLTSVAYGVLALGLSMGALTVWALMVAAGRADAQAARVARVAVPVRRRAACGRRGRAYHRN